MQYNNIKILVVILVACIGFPYSYWAQIEVNSGDTEPYTPINIIESVFLGSGVEIINIQFDGEDNAVGVFSNGSSYIGLEHGILLSTGFAVTAAEGNDPNTNAKGGTSNTSIVDTDLQSVAGAGSDILDIARYEITFIPESDNIRFRYVFASEEYPEFVCSSFNDVFGFFISGPDPSGGNYNALNIARVPDPLDPSGTTFLNNNVSINSVNSGELGTLGSIDVSNCSGIDGSLNFSDYYNEVPEDINQFPVYDAYLDVFIAQADVIPCEEYTIKIAIGDVKDQDFDSAVFLEAASLYSPSMDVAITTLSPDGAIAEGCEVAEIEISIPRAVETNTPVLLNTLAEGQFPDQARNNTDYIISSTNISIPAGATSTTISIEAIEDSNPELDEFIYLDFQSSVCKRDTLKIRIIENGLPQVMLPMDTAICANDILRLIPVYDPPIMEFEPQVFSSGSQVVISESEEIYTSVINVQGVEADDLNFGILTKICIDSLVTRELTDIELYLIAPQGQLMELSTHNGLRTKPTNCVSNPNSIECLDSLYNTCFTFDATNSINNGNALLGSIYPGNKKYEGEFLPEGDWGNILTDDASANGAWQLLVSSDSVSIQDIANQNSFLGSWSIHFDSKYVVDHVWSPNFNISDPLADNVFVSPDLDITYKLNVTDTYGCTSFDEIRVTVLPVTETPEIESCVALSPSSIQITWTDVGAGVENYQVNHNLSNTFFETTQNTFTFEGLESDTEHTFYVSAFNGQCNTAIDSLVGCPTLPCTGIGPEILNVFTLPPTCNGRNDGQIFAQASTNSGGEVNYFVENLSNTTGEFNFLTEGNYTLRVVDEFGCATVQSVTIPPAQDLEIELLGTPISCVGLSDAVAVINIPNMVNAPYTILWQNQSEEFTQSDLGMGTYFFTITDAGGCNFEKNIQIQDPEPLSFENIDAQLPACFGDEGSIEITMKGGTPGYSFDWEDTTENTSFVSFAPGNYAVTVSDANDCTISTEVEIEERLQINLVPDSLQAACLGELSHEIVLEIEGGAPSFDVQWNGSISGPVVDEVPVGFYELTITDSNNCVLVDSIEILYYPELQVEFDLREPECFNTMDGIISVASTVYSDGVVLQNPDIIWETGSTDEAIGNLRGDESYRYTITDSNGCKHIDSVYLGSPPTIFPNIDTINLLSCFEDQDGSFSVSPSGGTGELTIKWSSNIVTLQGDIASDLGVGLYSVTICDEDGCSLGVDFSMTQPDELIYSGVVEDIACFGEATGEILGEVQGGVGPYDIIWSNGGTLDSLTGLVSGSYEISVVDANGCTFQQSFEIEQPEEALDVSFEVFETECFMTATGSIDVFASGGTMPYNILLDSVNYFDNLSITGLSAGSYDLIVIDRNGCEFSFDNIIVEETEEVFVSLPGDTTVEFGSSIILEFMTNSNDLVEFFWEASSPEVIFSCIDCPNPVIEEVTSDFFVTLTVRDSAGCKYTTDRYWIFESDDSFIEVPTGFSPNGDNRNDRLFVFGKPGVEIMNFEVFNRWGELIHSDFEFEVNDTSHFWDGTYNGSEVDSGVYVWKIQIKRISGDIEYLEGNVTLLR